MAVGMRCPVQDLGYRARDVIATFDTLYQRVTDVLPSASGPVPQLVERVLIKRGPRSTAGHGKTRPPDQTGSLDLTDSGRTRHKNE